MVNLAGDRVSRSFHEQFKALGDWFGAFHIPVEGLKESKGWMSLEVESEVSVSHCRDVDPVITDDIAIRVAEASGATEGCSLALERYDGIALSDLCDLALVDTRGSVVVI